MNGAIRRVVDRLMDLVWPRNCAVTGCGRMNDRPGHHICSRCLAGLPFLESGGECSLCGRPVPAKTHHDFICEECLTTRPAFDRARSALRYAFATKDLVQAFKYRHALQLTMDFCDFLEATTRAKFDAAAVDAVVPVPLHPHRLRERGYNQSGLLAEALARRLNRRFDGRSLVRRRDTEHQARLSGTARRTNMNAAFAVKRPGFVRGRTIMLIDDVMTTGTTLSACAHALHAAGAAAVWALTVARATEEG